MKKQEFWDAYKAQLQRSISERPHMFVWTKTQTIDEVIGKIKNLVETYKNFRSIDTETKTWRRLANQLGIKGTKKGFETFYEGLIE